MAEFIRSLLPANGILYDVGAHRGEHAFSVARDLKTGHVYAFEPDSGNYSAIVREATVWGLQDRLTAVHAAVSDRNGQEFFVPAFSHFEGKLERICTTPHERSIIVPSTTLDLFSDAHPKPTVVKVDVEGAEHLVIQGASGLLKDSAPRVVVAYHGTAQLHECTSRLEALRYRVFQGASETLFAVKVVPRYDAPEN